MQSCLFNNFLLSCLPGSMARCRGPHLDREEDWLSSFRRRYRRIPFNDLCLHGVQLQFQVCPWNAAQAMLPTCILSNISLAWEGVHSLQCTSSARVTASGCLVVGFDFLLSRWCSSGTCLSAPKITWFLVFAPMNIPNFCHWWGTCWLWNKDTLIWEV